MAARPVPVIVMAEPEQFTHGSDSDQQRIFKDNFNDKMWKKICKRAGLFDLKFYDLRKAFSSIRAQNGVSIAVTQRFSEHSSPSLTNKIYTNVDTVLRQSMNKLPVDQWLRK